MYKTLILIILSFTLISCASVKDKMPVRKACTGDETGKTLADIFCKKD